MYLSFVIWENVDLPWNMCSLFRLRYVYDNLHKPVYKQRKLSNVKNLHVQLLWENILVWIHLKTPNFNYIKVAVCCNSIM